MNTTNETPATVTLLGKVLELRGDNGIRASWTVTVDGAKFYVYRGPDAVGNGPVTWSARFSIIEDGHPNPIAGAEGSTLEVAEAKLLEVLRRMGLKA